MTKVAVLGATGFTGEKLVSILLNHPKVEITYLASRTPTAIPYHSLFPRFFGKTKLYCENFNVDKAVDNSDILFLSLPHTVSMEIVPYLLKKKKRVIDLSADYRIKDALLYKRYYHSSHKDKANLRKAVYGLTEIYKGSIQGARLIANPGCYPTSIILPLFPLLKERVIDDKVIVDSKSAITGAGRKASIDYHYVNISNNLWAYKPFAHQHIPEVVSALKDKTGVKIELNFVPHVVGVEAGIYSTIYLSFKNRITDSKIKNFYKEYYKGCPFIRIKKELPKLKDVVGTNFCDIGFVIDEKGRNAVIASAIDNLVKGAAGSAVQNMNVMLGWDETSGLL